MSATVIPFRRPRGAVYDDPVATWEAGSAAYREANDRGRPPVTRDAARAGLEACTRAMRLFSWLVRYYGDCEGSAAIANESQCRRNVDALLMIHDSFLAALREPAPVIPLPWVTLPLAKPRPELGEPRIEGKHIFCRVCGKRFVYLGPYTRHEAKCKAARHG